MPRGIPGSGPYAKKNKVAGGRKTKTVKNAAPKKVTAKKPAKRGAKKKKG